MISVLHACVLAALTAVVGPSLEHEPALTPYGLPHLEWKTLPPTLVDPQPEAARVWLDLPEVLLPPTWKQSGERETFDLVLNRRAEWSFSAQRELSLGLAMGALDVRFAQQPRAIELGLVVLPRASMLQLRFDPLGALR